MVNLRCKNPEPRVSQMGQSLPSHDGIKFCDVRCWSDSCQKIAGRECSEVPIADIPRRSEKHRYSITSSARASSDGGISRPSAFAVFRLITSSYLVGFCTGRSAGFAPLKIRST